jgi:hypothetical protein
MTNASQRLLGGLVLAVTVFPSAARAQPTPNTGLPVATFGEIASRVNLKAGATLIVTDSSGQQVKGKLTTLSTDTLSILAGRRTLTFSDQQVRELRQRLPDSKREGALIGLAAAWLVPAVVCTSGSDSSETFGCVLGTLVLGGLPGLAIGAAIDAVQEKTVTVFRSPASARVVVAPAVTMRGIALRATMRFQP